VGTTTGQTYILDTSVGLFAYTPSFASPATGDLRLNNKDYTPPAFEYVVNGIATKFGNSSYGNATTINGGAVPLSSSVVGTNGAGQLVAQTIPTLPTAYTTPVSAQTTFTITAVTHGQGTSPVAYCFDSSSPAIANNCYYTRAANGDLVFTFSPAFTGTIQVVGNPNGVTSDLACIVGGCTIGSTIVTVSVSGVTRAIKFLDSAGKVGRVVLFYDSAVTNYGNPATVGSIAWAIALLDATRGGKIELGAGIFPVVTRIVVSTQNVTISGLGPSSTMLHQTNGANLSSIINYHSTGGSNIYFFQLRNLEIDGNSANNPTAGDCVLVDNTSTGISSDDSIDNVYVASCKRYGIHQSTTGVVSSAWGARLSNLWVEYSGLDGIYIEGGSQCYIGPNVYSTTNGGNGFNLHGKNMNISNITADSNGQWGLYIANDAGKPFNVSNAQLFNNATSGTSYGGLNVGGNGNTLSNISIYQLSQPLYGMLVTGSANTILGVFPTGSGSTKDINVTGNNNKIIGSTGYSYADSGTGNSWN